MRLRTQRRFPSDAGDDSYILTVQPGYDLAFLVAITITLNDIINPDMA